MRQKELYYIAHVCLNSKLSKKHPDYCERGFVDLAPNGLTLSEQCWKYCTQCEAKGYPVITHKIVTDAKKAMIKVAHEASRKRRQKDKEGNNGSQVKN